MSDEKKSYFRREQVEGFTQKSKTGKTFTRNYPALSDVSLENIRLGRSKRVLPLEEFIKVSRQKHGDKFDYSLVEYETVNQKVKIIFGVNIDNVNTQTLAWIL